MSNNQENGNVAHATRRATRSKSLTEGIQHSFSLNEKRRRYLEVEVALAQAQGSLGMIPQDAADSISKAARTLDRDGDLLARRIQTRVEAHGHTMMALVEVLTEATGDHGGWVHWGATTQNIQQTGDVLILRETHGVIEDLLREIIDALGDLGERTAATPMAGRTHWQHAVPITFGLKVAAWTDQLLRHLERIEQLAPRLLRSMTGGAAGTFASFGEMGLELQDEVAGRLGLTPMRVPSRAIVDHFAEFVMVLGLVSATAQSIAEEVQRLNSPEYAEAQEAIPPGQVGSSTMPQKRVAPPLGAIVIAAAQARAAVPLALEAVIQSHEVDGARSVMMDRALENACVHTVDALENLRGLAQGLEVLPERMLENLSITGGLINAEAVMFSLAREIGRQEAHHAIHQAVEEVNANGRSFTDALLENERVADTLTRDDLDRLLDPARYTGLSEPIARRTAAEAHAAARPNS